MATSGSERRQRIPTGVPGLDTVLDGGLFRGGVYIVRGAPGAGKTILGNQICFASARRGANVAYVTLLAEAHARMMLHLEELSFFDPRLIAARVHYLSGFNALEAGGLRGVLELLRHELRARKVSLLVIDGLVALSDSSTSRTELKKFFHELQLHADLTGCVALLLTGPVVDGVQPENTMVDGILELREEPCEMRSYRELRVAKFRGAGHLMGNHFFTITNAGIKVHPRIEAVYARPSRPDKATSERVSTGVPNLDTMMSGGLPAGSTTMLVGPSGAGKTTLGLHYLAAAPPRTKSLYFGFYETPARLMLKARRLGLGLDQRLARKELELLWQPSTEQCVDELVGQLLEAIERTHAKRLFIDGLDGLQRATVQPERVHHVFTALANELRVRGVTTVYTYEVPKFIGPDLEAPITGVSALVENLIFMRFVEMRSQLYRMLSILKIRDSAYDGSLREFRILPQGIRLEDSFTTAEAILNGTARETARPDVLVVESPKKNRPRRRAR